jgi:hypothetical protein
VSVAWFSKLYALNQAGKFDAAIKAALFGRLAQALEECAK